MKEDPCCPDTKPMTPSCAAMILLAGMAGVAEVFWTAQWGIPVSPDGLVYLSAAQSFADGFGFLRHPQPDASLLTHFPPLYPFMVSLLLMLGADLNLAPVLLNAVLFFLLIVSLGWILFQLTNSPVTGAAAAWAGWLAPGIATWFAFPWSEPLFLLTSLWGLYFLARYLTEGKLHLLVASGFLLGMSFLTRYVGGSLWFTGVIALLLFSSRPKNTRLPGAVIFAFIAGSPMGFWLMRNWLLTGGLTDRASSFHPMSFEKFFEMILTFQPWLGIDRRGFPSLRSLWFSMILTGALCWIVSRWFVNNNPEKIQQGQHSLKLTAYMLGIVFLSGFFVSVQTPDADPFAQIWKFLIGSDTSILLLETLTVLFSLSLWLFWAIPQLTRLWPFSNKTIVSTFLKVTLLYAVLYFALLMISKTWFDATTRFLPRVLSPWYLTGFILFVLAAHRYFSETPVTSKSSQISRSLLSIGILMLLLAYSHQKFSWCEIALKTGLGDLDREWRSSSFLPSHEFIKPYPKLYSNFPVAYFLLTGHRASFRSLAQPIEKTDNENFLYIYLSLFKKHPDPDSEKNWQWIYQDDKSVWFIPENQTSTP